MATYETDEETLERMLAIGGYAEVLSRIVLIARRNAEAMRKARIDADEHLEEAARLYRAASKLERLLKDGI
jgi:hypothetical protein